MDYSNRSNTYRNYFLTKANKDPEFNYNTNVPTNNNSYPNTNTNGQMNSNSDLSAEFNSADSEFNSIDVEGVDDGM